MPAVKDLLTKNSEYFCQKFYQFQLGSEEAIVQVDVPSEIRLSGE
jgi:hypothetical protein